MKKRNILITGLPGVGKTTLIKNVVEALKDLCPVGFYTASKPSARLVVIDEIGKMECLSDQFKNLLKRILDSDKGLIATIALRGSGIIEEIKKRKNVKLFEITQSNRNSMLSDVLGEIQKDVW